jgi:hypothetical protein
MRGRRLVALVLLVVLGSGCSAAADPGREPRCQSPATEGAYGTTARGILILAAQAVPSATLIPCIGAYPTGWTFAGSRTANGDFRFWLDSDRAGVHAVEVVLTAACDVSGAVEVVPAADEVDVRRFEEPLRLPPNFAANRYYTFEGGCIEYRYRFTGTRDATLVLEADQALGFRERLGIVDELAEIGLNLCGTGAPPCAGEPS